MHIKHAQSSDVNGNRLFILYYGFKLLGIVVCLVPIYLGYSLFILGVTGQASLSIKSTTVSGQLLNAAPGLFFAVGGIVALVIAIWKGVAIQVEPDGSFATCTPAKLTRPRRHSVPKADRVEQIR